MRESGAVGTGSHARTRRHRERGPHQHHVRVISAHVDRADRVVH